MKYWRVYKPADKREEDNLTKYYTCDACKFFYAKEHRQKAVVELRGNEHAEHARGMLQRLCQKHFQELKDAGEVEE